MLSLHVCEQRRGFQSLWVSFHSAFPQTQRDWKTEPLSLVTSAFHSAFHTAPLSLKCSPNAGQNTSAFCLRLWRKAQKVAFTFPVIGFWVRPLLSLIIMSYQFSSSSLPPRLSLSSLGEVTRRNFVLHFGAKDLHKSLSISSPNIGLRLKDKRRGSKFIDSSCSWALFYVWSLKVQILHLLSLPFLLPSLSPLICEVLLNIEESSEIIYPYASTALLHYFYHILPSSHLLVKGSVYQRPRPDGSSDTRLGSYF